MNNVIKYWDDNLVSTHIGTELKWLYNYLDEINFESISFIDIGGNVGKFYDEISKKYNVRKCVVVEPSKTLFNYLSEKFIHNDSVILFNFAISDENGSFDFTDSAEQTVHYFKDNENNNSINLGLSKLNKSNGDTKCYSMEFFMEKFNPISCDEITFIKIDTENMDLQIIKSLTSFLQKTKINPFILFENNYHNDITTEEAENIIKTFCELCGYEKVDLSNAGDKYITPIKNFYDKKTNNTGMKKIYELSQNFKIDKKFWNYINLSGDDYKIRGKAAPYIKKTIEIAKLLGLKKFVEIGSTRFAVTQKCIDYFSKENEPFDSPPCCTDGHCSFFFSDAGFDVHTVDIDINCQTQIFWSYDNLRRPLPENLTIHIPKDGIEFLHEHNDKIDILFLDGWDVGTDSYGEKHLEAFLAAENKLSDVHLILIDDTDFSIPNGGKDHLLTPYLIEKGYIPLFNGRQTLYINTTDVQVIEQTEKEISNPYSIDDNPFVVISLSTTPNRLSETREGWGIKPVIERLVNMTYGNYEIHLNIPFINHKTDEEYFIPKWLIELENNNKKLKIFRCHDYGSITKIVPTLKRIENPNVIIITVDDDLLYVDGFIEYHIKKMKQYPNSALGFAGLTAINGSCHHCTTLKEDTRVKILEGYKTVSYLRKYFKDDFFKEFVGQSWSDDILISAYLGKHDIEKIVINYEFDDNFTPVVESFPIYGNVPNEKSGCNLYREENISDNSNNYYKLGYLER